MNSIASLRVQHLRAHKTYNLKLSPTVTMITGPNGSGKTSLIEALYIAFQGSSFKGTDTDVLEHNAPGYRIDVSFNDGSTRTVKYNPSKTSGRKQFTVNNKPYYRLPFTHKYPVVLFEPEDLRLLNSSPVRRREFINHIISQLNPIYGLSLRRYERALKQRNSLLKQPYHTNDDIFAWDVSLSEYGAEIIKQRQEFIEKLNSKLQDTYRLISNTDDTLMITYSHNYTGNINQKLLTDLHINNKRDSILGYTSTGPHRHDLLFTLNNTPAISIASRGEVRTIVLALKFLEISMIKTLTNKEPIVLLDDVFSELDKNRQKMLLAQFSSQQTIITSVEATGRRGKVTVLER